MNNNKELIFRLNNGFLKHYTTLEFKFIPTMKRYGLKHIEDWPAFKYLSKHCFGHTLMHLTETEMDQFIKHHSSLWNCKFIIKK